MPFETSLGSFIINSRNLLNQVLKYTDIDVGGEKEATFCPQNKLKKGPYPDRKNTATRIFFAYQGKGKSRVVINNPKLFYTFLQYLLLR